MKLFVTLLVTSTPKRTFSTLTCMKTYLRYTMSEKNLNGLNIANNNKNKKFSENDVIMAFSQNYSRRQIFEYDVNLGSYFSTGRLLDRKRSSLSFLLASKIKL